MKIEYCFLLFLLCGVACKSRNADATHIEERFDKTKWRTKQADSYPNRNAMLKDLMTNKRWHGVTRDSLLSQFGQPDRVDSNYLFYRISQERLGYFPIHTKTLVIKFTHDTVEWLKIHE